MSVVLQIEGSSYLLREHADLLLEYIRSKANIQSLPIAPTLGRRDRSLKNDGSTALKWRHPITPGVDPHARRLGRGILPRQDCGDSARQTTGKGLKPPGGSAKRCSIAAFGLGVYRRERLDGGRPIRKYHNVQSVDEVRRRVEQEFVPTLKQNPGFLGYYLIDCGCPDSGNIVTSISIFDNWDSVLTSNDAAKNFIKKRLADLIPEPADAVGGEAIVSVSQQHA
jgi:hypothetical protein